MSDEQRPTGKRSEQQYWRWNIAAVLVLLTIWFLVSLGAGVLFVDRLNTIRLPGSGFKLGFWFAQQGSIYVFIVLILVYVVFMGWLDRKFGVDETDSGDAS